MDPFGREPFDIPLQDIHLPRPPRRFWIALALFGLAILLFFLAGPVVGVVTELQWYTALNLGDVYGTRLKLEFGLVALALVASIAFTVGNVLVALRLRSGSGLRTIGIKRRFVRTLPGAVGVGTAVLLSLLFSAGAGSDWQQLALYLHASPTGTTDPVFGMDVSFYLLQLPLIESVVGWLTGLVFVTGLLVAGLHAWRGETIDFNLGRSALAHTSVLLAVFALLLGVRRLLDRYDYLSGHDSVVWGAGYTDVSARIPLAVVSAGLAVVLAVLLVANVRIGRLWPVVASVTAWILMSIVNGVYPGIVQRIVVAPAEPSVEAPYIQREIAATRKAFGIDAVATSNFGGGSNLTAQDVAGDQPTIQNLRLWDYRPLQQTYNQLQTIRSYYTFADIDLDRYSIRNNYQQLEISARQLDTSKLPTQANTWTNIHLQYTHGYGVAGSPVSAVVGEGLPDYVVRDIPPAGSLPVTKPGIYFGDIGDVTQDYVLAPSAVQELDYSKGTTGDVYTNYQGTHGVKMDGFTKALWSLKTSDFNLLISSQVQDRTQILYRRNIKQRVSEIAPFLTFDSDPYVAVVDGKLYWIMDGYTTASSYPYSQLETGLANNFSGDVNYIRNSVKVVIDAYEGTPTFYVSAPQDPIIQAYMAAFPTMFRPISDITTGLRAHLRVPEQMFTIQADVFRTYHVTDPSVFYKREDVWAFPQEQTSPTQSAQTLSPYYVMMRLPGQTSAEFLLIMPFTPNNKSNMISWLAARCDAPNYGQQVAYLLPKDQNIFGPLQISSRINETPAISRDFSLFNSQGSSVIQGNLLVVPIGDTFLYVEPIYLTSTNGQGVPELKKVILADSKSIAYADTLQAALDQLVGQAGPSPGPSPSPGPTPGGTGGSAQLQQLAQQALLHYQRAQAALRNGDLSTYASEMAQVAAILQQMAALTASPSPSPGASPGASTSPAPSASP